MSEHNIVILGYFLVSIMGLFICRVVSEHFSGNRLNLAKLWGCLAITILWGQVQWGVAKNGNIMFFENETHFLHDNITARWIGFAAAFLQILCIPSKNSRKQIILRKLFPSRYN